MNCPEGHTLPYETEAGQCTPMRCAAPSPLAPPESSLVPVEGRVEGVDYSGESEKRFVDKALAREAIRNSTLKVPKGLTGAAAEAWSDKRLAELLPIAVSVYEERLRFGNDEQRFKAAKEIAAANGRGPREAGGRVGALIIIQANGEQATTPRYLRKPSVVVDSTAKLEPKDPKDA